MKLYRITQLAAFSFVLYALIGSVVVYAENKESEREVTISSGKEVSIEYTLTLEDKAVVDTNVGSNPLKYIQGARNIVPGLEKALEGLKVGDSKQVTVKPEEGYGDISKEAFLEVKKEQIPEDALKVGAQLQSQSSDGQIVRARVIEIKEETVLLDFNHPLAGKTLYFDVKVLDIQEGPAK